MHTDEHLTAGTVIPETQWSDDSRRSSTECSRATVCDTSSDSDVTLSLEREEENQSIYSSAEKWGIVIMATAAGLFSPLTSNIYYPAIPALAEEFGKSVELINLTVTMYMVLQGISPMFWGTLADHWGRRPMFLVCLLILSLSCVGIALVPSDAYWLLMLLRCLQAAGSASTVSFGAGVVGDISSRAQRGGFIGLFTLGPLLGPVIGPVIGGSLAGTLGWRSIFWFLCIGSSLCFVAMLCFLPETLHSIVGDGSIRPPALYRPLVPVMARNCTQSAGYDKPPHKSLVWPFKIFLQPDVAIILFFNAVLYAAFYSVTTSVSSFYSEAYLFLSEIEIGLCFLPFGAGMIIGSFVSGKRLNIEYLNVMRSLERKDTNDTEAKAEELLSAENFPIEYARYRSVPIFFAIFVLGCVGYGWCLQRRVPLPVLLVLQAILSFAIVNVTNTASTLLVDLLPSQSGSVTACNNLMRCSFGAAFVSAIDPVAGMIGVGWTYTALAGLCVVVGPLMLVIIRVGPRWRAKRSLKQISS